MTTSSLATSPVVLRPYRLRCRLPALAAVIERSLHPLGWEACDQAPIGLLIDGPWGIALQELAEHDPSEWVIVTDKPLPGILGGPMDLLAARAARRGSPRRALG